MEINCSFQRLVGGCCSQDKRRRVAGKSCLIVPLRSCVKDISAHKLAGCGREWYWIVSRSHFSTGIDSHVAFQHFGHDYLSSPSLPFGHWIAKRLKTVPYSSRIIETCQGREISQGWPWNQQSAFEAILRRTGISLPFGSGKSLMLLIYNRTLWQQATEEVTSKNKISTFNLIQS